MPTKSATTPTPEDLFDTVDVAVRGKHFRFRELSASEYDACVKLATSEETGDVDTVQLLRQMIRKGSVEPVLSYEDLGKLPFGVVTAISKAVNDLHFSRTDDDAEQPETPELDKDGNEVRPNS